MLLHGMWTSMWHIAASIAATAAVDPGASRSLLWSALRTLFGWREWAVDASYTVGVGSYGQSSGVKVFVFLTESSDYQHAEAKAGRNVPDVCGQWCFLQSSSHSWFWVFVVVMACSSDSVRLCHQACMYASLPGAFLGA